MRQWQRRAEKPAEVEREKILLEQLNSIRAEQEPAADRQLEPEQDPAVFRRSLQQLTEAYAGIVRTEAGLREGLSKFEELKQIGFSRGAKEPAYFFENQSLLVTTEAVLRAALKRNESRGPHLRFAEYDDNIPAPRNDAEWEKYIVIKKTGEKMMLEVRTPPVG